MIVQYNYSAYILVYMSFKAKKRETKSVSPFLFGECEQVWGQ